MIVAHRGLHSFAPENSLEAFIAAAEAGLSGVECDVWPSADNFAIVIHDDTLDRTFDYRGEVRKHSLAELVQMGVPSLTQVIDALNKLTAPGLVVEIKPRINRAFVESVLRTLNRYDGTRMIHSFHDDNIIRVWGIETSMSTAMLVDDEAALQKAVGRGWPFINAHYPLVTSEVVEQLHARGRRIGAWSVNQPDDIRRLIRLGIDMLITDDPILATAIARE